VPRSLPPASSRREAQELLYEFYEAMKDLGLAREADVSTIPAELRALGAAPGRLVLETALDTVVADWTGALAEQAGLAREAPGPRSGKAKKSKRPRKRKGG
jgi:hypothetical protein